MSFQALEPESSFKIFSSKLSSLESRTASSLAQFPHLYVGGGGGVSFMMAIRTSFLEPAIVLGSFSFIVTEMSSVLNLLKTLQAPLMKGHHLRSTELISGGKLDLPAPTPLGLGNFHQVWLLCGAGLTGTPSTELQPSVNSIPLSWEFL